MIPVKLIEKFLIKSPEWIISFAAIIAVLVISMTVLTRQDVKFTVQLVTSLREEVGILKAGLETCQKETREVNLELTKCLKDNK